MRKVDLILIIFIFLTGCSGFRKVIYSEKEIAERSEKREIGRDVYNNNITNGDFFIQKARVEIFSQGEKHFLLASIKFKRPDSYLISLRSKAGIEVARIYFTDDTVLINDRINRQILFGKPGQISRKFGISMDNLPLMLGDYVGESKNNVFGDCENGTAVINSLLHGEKMIFKIDCRKEKLLSANKEGSNVRNSYAFKYEKFKKLESIIYPTVIKAQYSETNLIIQIEKIESPWNGEIEFIGGKNYELIELL